MSAMTKNRKGLLVGLILLWAVLLVFEYGGGSGKAEAVVVPIAAPVDIEQAPVESKIEKLVLIAPPEVQKAQRDAWALDIGPNPLGRPEQMTTRTVDSSGPKLTSILGKKAVINGTTLEIGDVIPGTSIRVQEVHFDHVKVETNGTIRVLRVQRSRR